MKNRVEMNEEMMAQVNGGARSRFAIYPSSPSAAGLDLDQIKKSVEEAK